MAENEPLTRLDFKAAELIAAHPARLVNRNKEVIYAKACPPGCVHRGTLEFTRWREMRLPNDVPPASPQVDARAGIYEYSNADLGCTDWYVNFADEHLFFGYRGALLAQDELQIAEHPVLASLREALLAKKIELNTLHDGRPTPVLITGAERRCALALDRNAEQGRPYGLYGNNFGEAPVVAIEKAIRVIDPPTVTNLIAIAAPSNGSGAYSKEEIELILVTAYTGFRAAKLESQRVGGESARTVIHTGFWGCGAFGGNRELIAVLQLLAARLAGVDRVVFHSFDAAGLQRFEKAHAALDTLLAEHPRDRLGALIEALAARGYEWGVSDGT